MVELQRWDVAWCCGLVGLATGERVKVADGVPVTNDISFTDLGPLGVVCPEGVEV